MDYLKNNYKQILLLFVVPLIFLFRMVIFGEIITTNDELERHPINQWRDSYLEKNNDIPQWYPNLFSGMPSYGGYIYNNGDPLKGLRNKILFNPGLMIWFYLSILGSGMYALLRCFSISKYSAVFGALACSLTPYTFGLIGAGHLNKIFAMAYIPWIFLASVLLVKKISTIRILFLTLAATLQLWMNHPQVVYYTWMVVGFYFVWQIGVDIYNRKYSSLKSSTIFFSIVLSLILSLVIVSDPYHEIYKFQEHSNRGASSVIDPTNQTKSGTKWDYATQWSFHPKELISFIYPYHYGLQNHKDINRGAYWGFMPFTQSTHYLGLIVLIFAVLGLLILKPGGYERLLWVITFLIVTTGFGSIVPVLYKPFYEYLPLFSKFRVPSMIYLLLAIIVPILSARGLDIFLDNLKHNISFKKISQLVGTLGVISFILFISGDFFIDFTSDGDLKYSALQISQLRMYRISLFEKGLIIALGLIVVLACLIFALKNNKISPKKFQYGIIIVSLMDIGFIGKEFIQPRPAKNFDRIFTINKRTAHILKDESHFRIFPADNLGTNRYSYWNIESIGGYRPIKLRNYQDLMDAGGLNNPKILDMLNVKYVLTKKKITNPQFVEIDNIDGLYENKKVLPRAWLVGEVRSVKSQRESLMEILLGSFDPRRVAIINNYDSIELPKNVKGEIIFKSKTENRIELESNSETGGLLVLSEVYYQPGWKASVNGLDAAIFQTNHVLRSVRIPEGHAQIVFEYDSSVLEKLRYYPGFLFLALLFALMILLLKDRAK